MEEEHAPNPNPSPMPPPPPRNPIATTTAAATATATATATQSSPSPSDSNPKAEEVAEAEDGAQSTHPEPSRTPPPVAVPYSIPEWSEPPGHPFYLEVLKQGAIVDQLDVSVKGAYMFGRVDLCDFVLDHPSISRFHAVLQFKCGEVFLYDLGSTHGTFINKSQVKKQVYTDVHVGDVIRFGQSSRLYIFQGPSDLMPPEGDLNKLKKLKMQEEIQDREASLLRARVEASLVDGISWGMTEDAIEETTENDADEITWQTYRGQLTERQEKTRGKIIKRMEKVANMKKEIDAIRAKDVAQGGLTQGQQTQIARNEQRMQQIMEELESLEETLNESIQESIGARAKKVVHSKKKGTMEEEDEEFESDDDEFYDRTKKRPSHRKGNDKQSIETADTLLDKKEIIVKEMEEKTSLLEKEKAKAVSSTGTSRGEDDALDAYMTGLSSELAIDVTMKIQKEISTLQTELDRILYLLKIADPTGEAAQKRDAKSHTLKHEEANNLITDVRKQGLSEKKKTVTSGANNLISDARKQGLSEKKKTETSEKSALSNQFSESVLETKPLKGEVDAIHKEQKDVYTIAKPQWLGAVKDMSSTENHVDEVAGEVQEHDKFINYKDRKKVLTSIADKHETEDAASGLIIRKRKHTEESELPLLGSESTLTSSEAETTAADAVALLLKHKRGYFAAEDGGSNGTQQNLDVDQPQKKSQSKRVLGPEKPAFLDTKQDYESWVPPEGQLGDGRTSLNDKFGY